MRGTLLADSATILCRGDTMDFEFDVLRQLRPLDNTSPDEHHKGWVAKLHETLDRRLTQLLGKPTRIWRDPKLKGNDVFEEVLVLARPTRGGAGIGGVPPLRAVGMDHSGVERVLEGGRAAARRADSPPVTHLQSVEDARCHCIQQSPPLQSLLGYEFFRVDPDNGNFREFDEQFRSRASRSS